MVVTDKELVEMLSDEFERGRKSKINEIILFIKKRKWVWNEEKFGSLKNHKLFDEFVQELIIELKKQLLEKN